MKRNNFVYIPFGIITIAAMYFLLNPLFYDIVKFLSPKRLIDLKYANQYYSILYSFFGVIFSVGGLSLGAFYYFNKKHSEQEIRDREGEKQKREKLLYELNEYNRCMHKILTINVKDQKDLDFIRSIKVDCFDNVVMMLDNSSDLGLDDDGVDTILRVNSYVDKHQLISHSSIEILKKNDLYSPKHHYLGLIAEAKKICYLT